MDSRYKAVCESHLNSKAASITTYLNRLHEINRGERCPSEISETLGYIIDCCKISQFESDMFRVFGIVEKAKNQN